MVASVAVRREPGARQQVAARLLPLLQGSCVPERRVSDVVDELVIDERNEALRKGARVGFTHVITLTNLGLYSYSFVVGLGRLCVSGALTIPAVLCDRWSWCADWRALHPPAAEGVLYHAVVTEASTHDPEVRWAGYPPGYDIS